MKKVLKGLGDLQNGLPNQEDLNTPFFVIHSSNDKSVEWIEFVLNISRFGIVHYFEFEDNKFINKEDSFWLCPTLWETQIL